MKNIPTLSYYFLFLILIISCTDAKKSNVQTIVGHIKGLDNNNIILIDERSFPIDTVSSENGEFRFEHDFDISNPIRYGLFIPQLSNADGGTRQNNTFFFIDNKTINISGKISNENLEDIKVEGSPITKEYIDLDHNLPANVGFRFYEKPYMEAFTNYNQIDKSEENLKQLQYYDEKIDSLYELKSKNLVEAIADNPESIALSNMIYWYFKDESPEFIKNTLDQFSSSIKNSHYLSLLETELKLKEASSVGATAPNFVLKDNLNKDVSLSDFKGQYVLLDFWASWCAPCIREIPNLIQAHNSFNEKGLKIIFVSIDSSRDKWEKALQKENLPYLKLFDSQGMTKELYQYIGIPHIVLISPEGKIIKINEGLRGDQLQKTLEHYLS